jgi:hypothetical protein
MGLTHLNESAFSLNPSQEVTLLVSSEESESS